MAPTAEISPGLERSAAWVLNDTPLPAGQRILQLPPTVRGPRGADAGGRRARSHAAGYVIWVWPDDALENQQAYARPPDQGMDGLNINFPAPGVAAVQFTAGH